MFTAEPAEFASFREELIFEYAQDSSADLTFELELDEGEVSREVKKLYNVSSAKINIAPIIANIYMPSPTLTSSALTTPESSFSQVVVKCGEVESTTKQFVASKRELPQIGVMTSMPTSRTISYGEGEEIWVRAESGSTITFTAEAYNEGETTTTTFEAEVEECGFLRFKLDTYDFNPYTKRLKLNILCNDESIEEIIYYYIPHTRNSVRLAWIGDYGAIEHYTFPVINSLKKTKSGSREYEIESAYEKSSVIEALSEVLSSERVWVVDKSGYCEVQLLTTSVALNTNGELSTITYKLERYD